MPLFLGKESISLTNAPSFTNLPYVQKALNQTIPENPFIFNCCHGDHVSVPPPEVTLQGESIRTPHEIWTQGLTILSMQGHPEMNDLFIQKFIIERLVSLGRFDQT
jgi:hypothetical protein